MGPICLTLATSFLGSLFAAGDAALASLPEARLQRLTSLQDARGAPFRRYSADRLRLHSRWLVARVAAIALSAGVLASWADTELSPQVAPLVGVLSAIFIYGTFAEILSTVGRRRPEEVAALALRWLWPLELAVVPLAAPLAALAVVLLFLWVAIRLLRRLLRAAHRSNHQKQPPRQT